MTKHFLLFAFILCGTVVFSQSGKSTDQVPVINNVQRYKIDYEIKNATSVDSTLVLSLNLDQYEHLRTENTDVEIVSVKPSAVIILYSIEKCQLNKRKMIYNSQGK